MQGLRIGVYCLSIDPEYSGGINSYTKGLLKGFLQTEGNHRVILFIGRRNATFFSELGQWPNLEVVILEDFFFRFKQRIVWQFIKLNSKWAYRWAANFLFSSMVRTIEQYCDLVYFPNTTIFPYCYTLPTVVSMHDIQHVHYPEFFTDVERKSRRITFELTARHVSILQASSVFMKKDFLDFFRFLRTEQVLVIPEGVDIDMFRNQTGTQDVLKKYDIAGDFLLYPAQLWPHKNHLLLLEALLHIEKEHGKTIPLVLTGASYRAGKQIMEFIKEHQMHHVYYLGKVPFDDLLALYKRSRFVITASLYESSCLPVLEAAAAGTPILASSIPPNKEMTDHLMLNLFESSGSHNLAHFIIRCWNKPELAIAQVQHNTKHIERYSWKNTASAYISAFKEIKAKAVSVK